MDARVRLYSSHHPFYKHRKEFTEVPGKSIPLERKMLEWPIREHESGTLLSEYNMHQYRAFLGGLLQIQPFSAALTLHVNRKEKFLQQAKYDWGIIYHDSIRLLIFQNRPAVNPVWAGPYERFWQWPRVGQHVTSHWDVEAWKMFFINSIKQDALAAKTRAQGIIADEQRTVDGATAILHAIDGKATT